MEWRQARGEQLRFSTRFNRWLVSLAIRQPLWPITVMNWPSMMPHLDALGVVKPVFNASLTYYVPTQGMWTVDHNHVHVKATNRFSLRQPTLVAVHNPGTATNQVSRR